VFVSGRLDWEEINSRVQILFMLIPITIQLLPEVTLVIEKTDCNERNSKATRTLHVVTSQDTKASGINWH
jgi:hypothetical protein